MLRIDVVCVGSKALEEHVAGKGGRRCYLAGLSWNSRQCRTQRIYIDLTASQETSSCLFARSIDFQDSIQALLKVNTKH